tara:strand:- start:286 stop:582 length:297 start_codon:yes stop_codon:yes gene_type:complete
VVVAVELKPEHLKMVCLVDLVEVQLETVPLVELECQDKVILVDQLMPLLEKVVAVVVELELLVALVGTLRVQQVEQEVLRHHYHHAHLQVVAVVVRTV